eukprot:GHVU01113214.1.p3 GENE.GHVU01113214.1~~GHVU01113214.1.p3  ORF type:complete len:115 (+),score=15.37 GHVU01113214.1:443-787(+)
MCARMLAGSIRTYIHEVEEEPEAEEDGSREEAELPLLSLDVAESPGETVQPGGGVAVTSRLRLDHGSGRRRLGGERVSGWKRSGTTKTATTRRTILELSNSTGTLGGGLARIDD